MMMRRGMIALALSPLLSLGAGCSGQRAVHMVEASGDRAMVHGDPVLAASEYREVVERAPARIDARIKYAGALLKAGDHRLAREEFEKCYTLRPNDEGVIQGLADSMVASGDSESAVQTLRTIAEEKGKPADWMRLGRLFERVNDADAAEKSYLTAARGDLGVSMEPQRALADLYRKVGKDSAALERYRMCYYLDPTSREIHSLIREFGEVPGPSIALRPTEQYAAPSP
ncbi:MAG TPA: hypothetical protein DEB06_02975 [Phycisphaerales bacterium]|nr:hypothetical protein [Phycisphaerales bacterium]